MPRGFTKFARQRLLKSRLMLGVLSGLQTLYGQSDPMTSWVRNIGVGAVNTTDWLKQQIMLEALGGFDALDAAENVKNNARLAL